MAGPSNRFDVLHSGYATDALGRSTTFLGLPEDALLQIFEWLSVSDILALRSVNLSICEVTRNSAVWLSFLRRLTLALSPRQHILSDVDSLYTVEYAVSRALKLEQNWRDYNPLPRHYRFNGHQRILAMKNLPGSKHMASISQNIMDRKESVVIWDMNYRGRRNHVAIAMLNSATPIQKLQVGYALVDSQECLLFAFTRPPENSKTTIISMCITLELLETLSRLGPGTRQFEEFRDLIPNPFSRLLEIQTRYPVGALSLSDVRGQPVLATVHRPRTIAFYFLDQEARSLLKLGAVSGYNNWRHSIWEIKILPSQNQVLVIRVLIGGDLVASDTNPIVFEVYDIPLPRADVEGPAPCETKTIEDHRIDGFYVSDAEASWWSRSHESRTPMLHELANCPPPPISIFMTTKQPRGFIHYLMLPEITHNFPDASMAAEPSCIYKLPTKTHAAFEWDEDERAVILPGAYRSVVWMRSPGRQPLEGIEVLQLAVYRTEGYKFSDASDTGLYPTLAASTSDYGGESMDIDDDGSASGIVGDVVPKSPRDRSMKYPVVPEDLAQEMRNGMWAIQFDEWLGRLCVAITVDPWVHVLDWSS